MKTLILGATLAWAVSSALGGGALSAISGDYLEVRSCDVYTGPCFANAEMGLAGKEGMLFWSIREGSWNEVNLGGLSVMAVVKANGTLGDLKYQPRSGDAVLIVDAKAGPAQRKALAEFARSMSGSLISQVVEVRTAPIQSKVGACSEKGCASVKAGEMAAISTSCLANKHDVCGNEETFYPPLSPTEDAYPVYTELASYTGPGLDLTWQIAGKRSAFLGRFSAAESAAKDRLAAR